MNRSDFIPVDTGHGMEQSAFVRIDSISAVREEYVKIDCQCGKGHCEYGTHYYDDLYVNVEGTWYYAGRFDYDANEHALDRLEDVIKRSSISK